MNKVKFSEIATFVAGQSPESQYYSNNASDGTPFLQGNRTFGMFFPTFDTYTSKVTKTAKKGDILMSVRAPVGDLNFAPCDLCIGRGLSAINAKDGDNDFLFYALKYNIKNLIQKSSGTTFGSVNKDVVNDMDMIIPDDKNTRNKASAILRNIDTKIETNNRINSELESMAKTIYDYWFLQFEFPNEEGKPYKSSGGKMVWNDELKREIPEGWEVKPLGSLFDTNRGVSYATPNIINGTGTPMINLASFNIDGTYKTDGIKFFEGEYPSEKVLKPNDLVMCNTQQTAIDFSKDVIGKALLVPDIFNGDIISSHHVNTIKVHDDDLKYFLSSLFNTYHFHKYVSGYASGTNILGLTFSGVERYKQEIPHKRVLAKYASLMKTIQRQKAEIIKENQELASLRDFLLPMLMNGQVTFEDEANKES